MAYERGEKQEKIHSSAAVKFDLRREAYAAAGPGRAWVPYCGPGEVALACGYDPARCVAIDNDQAAIRAWHAKLPGAEVHAGDVEKFAAWGTEPYSYADIDPFGAPWKAMQAFLDNAPTTDPVVISLTDGFVAKKTQLGRYPYDFDRHRPGLKDSEAATAEVREWPAAAVRWLESLGWHVTLGGNGRAMGSGAGVRYCWLTLSRTAAATVPDDGKPPNGHLAPATVPENADPPPPPKGRARDEAALMYRSAGESYVTIGRRLGCSDKTAARAVQRALDRLPVEALDVLRRVHSDRLERLIAAGWRAAMDGDLDAIETCRKLLADTARLLGLERPARVIVEPAIKPEWSTW